MPDGSGGLRAMNNVLEKANVQVNQISHINCHATSTPVGDKAEAIAI